MASSVHEARSQPLQRVAAYPMMSAAATLLAASSHSSSSSASPSLGSHGSASPPPPPPPPPASRKPAAASSTKPPLTGEQTCVSQDHHAVAGKPNGILQSHQRPAKLATGQPPPQSAPPYKAASVAPGGPATAAAAVTAAVAPVYHTQHQRLPPPQQQQVLLAQQVAGGGGARCPLCRQVKPAIEVTPELLHNCDDALLPLQQPLGDLCGAGRVTRGSVAPVPHHATPAASPAVNAVGTAVHQLRPSTSCPYCGQDFALDVLKRHIPKCPRFMIDRSAQCIPLLPALADPLLPCVFKDIGCKFKGGPQALDQHLENSSRSHLALTCQIVSRQQAQISALRSALHSVTLNTTGTMLWKIPDFSSKLSDAKAKDGCEVCSPPFLTSAHGYKLQASLFLNGNGSGEGSHLSIYIKILPGEFDSLLRWPFSLTVSFTLMDRPLNPDKACHIVESFVPDPTWKNFQRPSKEPDALGFGFPRFVSHGMLKKCHYLREDVLFIKVKVDEGKVIAV